MTNAPTPDNEPESTSENESESSSSNQIRQQQRRRLALIGSLILLSGLGGGIIWLWYFVYQQLAPQVETSVTNLLMRPIKLGGVQSVSPTGLRFGPSSLPATPTDPDRATVEAVDVSFNLLPLLTERRLPLDVTLVKPKAYIEQADNGTWVNFKTQSQPKGAIDINLKVLRLRDANVILVPRGAAGNSRKPIVLSIGSGKARFLNKNKLIKFDLGGQLVGGGNLTLEGQTTPANGEIKTAIRAQDLSAPEVGRLIQLPLHLKAGEIDGNLEVTILPKKPLRFLGTANLDGVTAQLDPLPQPFTNTNGQLRFQDTQVRLEKVNTRFGQIPAQANGVVDTQVGFNLAAETQAVKLPQVLQTFKIQKLPVPVTAEVKAQLKVTGKPDKPVVSGQFTTTQAAQIDQVKFRSIASNFKVLGSTLTVSNLRALPTLGGLVTGGGSVQLGAKGGDIQFSFQGNNLPGDAIALTYDIKPPVPLGLISGSTQIRGNLNNAQKIRATGQANLNIAGGDVAIEDIQVANQRFIAQVQASGVQVGRLAEVPPAFRVPVSGRFTLSGPLQNLNIATIQGTGSGRLNAAGGTIQATNIRLNQGRFTAQVQASGVQVGRLAEVPPAFQVPVAGNFTLSGPLTDFTIAKVQGSGSGRLNVAGGTVQATDIQLNQGRFIAQVRASGVQVQRLANVPSSLQGPLAGNFTVSGPLTEFSTASVQGTGSGSLNIGGGTVRASNIQLANGRFQAQLQASGIPIERLAPVPPQARGLLAGNFNVAGALDNLSPSTIQGTGSGTLNVAGGTVRATNLQLADGRFTTQVQASGVQVGRLANVPPQLRGTVSGNFNLAGGLENLSPSTIQGIGSGRINLASGGTVTADTLQLANGRFQGVVEPTNIPLTAFSQDLKGRLGGRLNVGGSLTALSPQAIQASGQVNLSEGISIIDRPLTATINWTGKQLQIQQATAQGFRANGVIDVNLANSGLQAIRSLNLAVQAQDLNLQQLPVSLPNGVQVAGRADFDGSIAGTPNAPNVKGNLQLRDFAVAGLTFESPLSGSVSAVPGQGVNLQLAGNQDRIQVALSPNYQPTSFLIQQGEAIAQGTRQGDTLQVNAQEFPIALIKKVAPLPPAIASQPIDGLLSGDLAVNLNTYGISGTVAIAKPIFGTLRGDSFKGTLQYTDGVIALNDGQFIQGDNQYLISANLRQTPQGPQFQAKLDVPKGNLQSVLTALQIFDITDLTRGFNAPVYGSKTDVEGVKAGVPNGTLQNQLRRLSEIEALLAQRQEQENASPLPPLAQAQGEFSGSLSVVGSPTSGIEAEFDIQGTDWKWGSYSANQVIAQGQFQNGVLTLLPLRFQSGESFANFSGTLGGDAQSGQLQLTKIPIDQVQAIVSKVTNVPPSLVGLTGDLNATATLSGSIKNPQARGVVTLTDATLNQKNIQQAFGSFSYGDARLNFGSSILLADSQNPLSIEGSIPYQLPVATVAPDNNELALNINVQDDGLALLGLFTAGQVSWVDGQGNVQVAVTGRLNPQTNRPQTLEVKGNAKIENATIQASALPDNLTNVKGDINFNFNKIQVVDKLTGQFGGGTITVVGALPISQETSQADVLNVNIDELGLNLKGLYNGRVQTENLTIAGTALSPKIRGELNLFNGQVAVGNQGGTGNQSGTGNQGSTGGTPGGEDTANNRIEFDNLKLNLQRNIQVGIPPIANFLADGTLTLNGSLNNIRPEGTIKLQRGQVNLFTTQFRLVRGYENTARFTPGQGLDPDLNVRLAASVSESTQRRLPTDPLSSEISDAPALTGVGTVQTVRVQAQVEGPASQLADNIELTSSPSRSRAEIVALLGGSFVDTLGRGDTTLGLVNLAGSALLGSVQNIIGDALGLSEFRLFPTIITDEKERTSTLGLSAEAGIDIGRNLSVSIAKELTTDQPFQYGLRYRFNENLLLRGSTDFTGDSRAVVEYERRF